MFRSSNRSSLWLAAFVLLGLAGLACMASGSGLAPTSLAAEQGIPTIEWMFTPQHLFTVTPRPSPEQASTEEITSTVQISITLTPSTTPSLTPAPDPAACVSGNAQADYGLVKWVTDGATIVVDIRGQLFSVHYAGLDVPSDSVLVQPYGPLAKARNSVLVLNQVVRLVRDGPDKDAHGQLLRYVFVDKVFVNYELVKEGLASPDASPVDLHCTQTFQQAEQAAIQEGRGFWVQGSSQGGTPVAVLPATQPPQPGAISSQSISSLMQATLTAQAAGSFPLTSLTLTLPAGSRTFVAPSDTLPAVAQTGTPTLNATPSGATLPSATLTPSPTLTSATPTGGTPQSTATVTPPPGAQLTSTTVPIGLLASCEYPYVCFSAIFFNGNADRANSNQYAEIMNLSNRAVNVKSWKLDAGDSNRSFTFPDFTFQPGQICRVYTNETHAESCGFSFASSQPVWNTSSGCGNLYDGFHNLLSRFCYP